MQRQNWKDMKYNFMSFFQKQVKVKIQGIKDPIEGEVRWLDYDILVFKNKDDKWMMVPITKINLLEVVGGLE